jgi:gamma-glutamyltranspeptidase/glutathione hydrolase
MRRALLVFLAVVACKKSEPTGQVNVGSAAPPPAVVADAATGAGSAAADAGAVAHYRTDAEAWHLDPAVAGTSKTFMVVAESEQAVKAGHDILASGGNAVDAAVTTAFAMAVTHPSAGNIGGGGFAVVRDGKGKIAALDFRETAPGAATPDMYKGGSKEDSLFGDRAVGVPGSVAGLYELHKKFGKKKWAEVVAPAIAYARDGFVIDEHTHAGIEKLADKLRANAASAAIWLPGGKARATGEKVTIPELATVLERIAKQGPDGFYKGDTAAALVAEMKEHGGLITAADLAGYKAVWREPLHFDYRGKKFSSMPPPSSGGIVLAMTANLLAAHDLAKLGWHSADHVHWLTEVWRRAYAARNEIMGDPAFVKNIPVTKLMSKDYAQQLVATITDNATPSKDVTPIIEGNHTTNLCVVDASGMAVALTTTLNTAFGSTVTVSGFLLNNEMDDFTAHPGEPNVFGLRQGEANKIEPGKRMLSSMSPTIIEDDKGLYMVVGAQGGPRIITAVWQTLSNVIDFSMPVDRAVAAPRVHHQHLPDVVYVEEDSITKEVGEALKARGYKLDWTHTRREFGASNAIVRVPGGWQSAADPRGGGAAMGD